MNLAYHNQSLFDVQIETNEQYHRLCRMNLAVSGCIEC
jgi:hypothetical protein